MTLINFNKSLKKISNNFFNKTANGSIKVIYPDNEEIYFKGNDDGYSADIRLLNYKVFFKIIKKGPVGFAESYMDGDFTSTNLSNLLLFSYDNEKYFVKNKKIGGIMSQYIRFKHFLNENTKTKSKKNIRFHYDLGNDFYKLWLDPSMTYSSAIFSDSKKDLHQAQINKFYQIAKPLELNENSILLEIGCGWGGFSSYIAKEFGAKVKAITISKEQYEFASEKIYKEGLNHKVSIEMKDYRDINEKYSNIASIEMFEAVGKKYWEMFLNIVKNSLSQNGLASMQIITIKDEKAEKYQKNPDFIQQYIFPGGVLPSKKQLINLSKTVGISLSEVQSFQSSYAKTLNIWNDKFQNVWPNISEQGFPLRFKKMWEYYLSYCEAGFTSGATDVSQFIIKN